MLGKNWLGCGWDGLRKKSAIGWHQGAGFRVCGGRRDCGGGEYFHAAIILFLSTGQTPLLDPPENLTVEG